MKNLDKRGGQGDIPFDLLAPLGGEKGIHPSCCREYGKDGKKRILIESFFFENVSEKNSSVLPGADCNDIP
jgi:hypothetical protein